MTKWVYLFHEGSKDMYDLLGSKGSNLAEMTRIGVPVPPGFIVTTEACNAYLTIGEEFPEGMWEQELEALKAVETETGKKLGDPDNPLLVSCRSGAKFPMPGMMDTVLNIGLNDATAKGMTTLTGNETFVYNSYRRLIQMFGSAVLGIPDEPFEEAIEHHKKQKDIRDDTELEAEDWKALTEEFKVIVCEHKGFDFPQDALEQLKLATEAVFKSWNGRPARSYRHREKIPDELGTAVNITTMVFGNMGWDSGTGVAFTRNPATGERMLFGEFLQNAQGEDVISGTRSTRQITQLAEDIPQTYQQIERIAKLLEQHYREMQDLEFTVERGKLYVLTTRSGKRTAAAAVKIAVDMANEGLITKRDAVQRVEIQQASQFLLPVFDPEEKQAAYTEGRYLASGVNASPGVACGLVAFDGNTAEEHGLSGTAIILVRYEQTPDDIPGVLASEGILTSRGGATSHAAVVARQLGKPCVAGCEAIEIDMATREFTVGARTVREFDTISIDGTTGEVFSGRVGTAIPDIKTESSFMTLLAWADELSTVEVWANADYPLDIYRALEFGARGIGLCRTEHMFFEGERLPIFQETILAKTEEDREKHLARLLPFLRDDFESIFQAANGYPVIIRLIDPPLHEFLPSYDDLLTEVLELRLKGHDQVLLKEKEDLLEVVTLMCEANPMLGLRGIRLIVTMPSICRMQVRAIIEAACHCAKEGVKVKPKIMIPLGSHANEVKVARELMEPVAETVMKESGIAVDYEFGAMIEVPRAALTADQMALYAEFLSYGTNDLTQTTFGYSRDDAERSFLLHYVEHGILPQNPFQVLDRDGVGELMRIGTELARQSRPGLDVGICGEHAGDPSSIEFGHMIGLNHVSCSPFRVPIARLAAAHAAIRYSCL